MGDDAATVEQLRAELRQLREQRLADRAEIDSLQESLTAADARETALAEVLRVIASTPVDLIHVLDTIAEVAARLCDAPSAVVQRLDESTGLLGAVAGAGLALDHLERWRAERGPGAYSPFSRVPSRGFVGGRAFLDRRTIRIDDMAEAVKTEFPEARERQQSHGMRSEVNVPLIRQGEPIGVLTLQRPDVRPFIDLEIALLETFADQAVIAIENARLFEELEQRNAQLQESNRQVTEALEQQTATAEVLRVIASSPTDLSRSSRRVVESAARLCDCRQCRHLVERTATRWSGW